VARVLKEVQIKSKRIIKDSKNLNGPGEADITIDDEQLQKAGRTTLRDLLYKNVKGFNYSLAQKYKRIYC
jgi:thermostable 8-oxoguanine DNA glycosylase